MPCKKSKKSAASILLDFPHRQFIPGTLEEIDIPAEIPIHPGIPHGNFSVVGAR